MIDRRRAGVAGTRSLALLPFTLRRSVLPGAARRLFRLRALCRRRCRGSSGRALGARGRLLLLLRRRPATTPPQERPE